ncbi:MAG TPA: hydroxyisourate hydrolase [Vicinamibacterales bacterium]|nr:hydroxyisourate hydrolase [Vicinamibacterales bacterium]
MSAITTHVLDTARGRPAAGVAVVLEHRDAGRQEWKLIGRGETDADGRLGSLLSDQTPLEPGQYRLVFDTRKYFDAQSVRTFYPSVVIVFETVAGEMHYHVPLLLGPFGYTTYRGS